MLTSTLASSMSMIVSKVETQTDFQAHKIHRIRRGYWQPLPIGLDDDDDDSDDADDDDEVPREGSDQCYDEVDGKS